jgi:hypothetical protein
VVGRTLGVPSIMGRTMLLFEPGGWSLGLSLLLWLPRSSSLALLAVLGLLVLGQHGTVGLTLLVCLAVVVSGICMQCVACLFELCLFLCLHLHICCLLVLALDCAYLHQPYLAWTQDSPLVLGRVSPFSMGRALSGV